MARFARLSRARLFNLKCVLSPRNSGVYKRRRRGVRATASSASARLPMGHLAGGIKTKGHGCADSKDRKRPEIGRWKSSSKEEIWPSSSSLARMMIDRAAAVLAVRLRNRTAQLLRQHALTRLAFNEPSVTANIRAYAGLIFLIALPFCSVQRAAGGRMSTSETSVR